MRFGILLLAILPLVFCVDEEDLPTAAALIASAKNIPCADFIVGKPNTLCGELEQESGKAIEYFYQAFEENLDFDAAQDSCIAKGGYLASVKDLEELAAIQTPIDGPTIFALLKQEATAGAIVHYFLGYKKTTEEGPVKNVDGCSTGVLTMLAEGVGLDEVIDDVGGDGHGSTGDRFCVAVVVQSNADLSAMPDVSVELIPCEEASRYICKFSYVNNAIIFVSNDNINDWYQAEEQCQMKGGHLASIHDETEKAVFNSILDQKVHGKAWVGLNDINKEGHFQYSDYSLPKFTPFCSEPVDDKEIDCVVLETSMKPEDKGGIGCLENIACSTPLPYLCKIKNPACDEHTLLFKDYLVTLLSDVSEASKSCSGACSSGLASFFKPEPKPKTPTINRVLKKKTVKGKRKKFVRKGKNPFSRLIFSKY